MAANNMFLPFSLRDRQSSMRRLDRSHTDVLSSDGDLKCLV